MEMNVSRLKCIPDCLLCSDKMFMMYSINLSGEIWMNKALLLENEYE